MPHNFKLHTDAPQSVQQTVCLLPSRNKGVCSRRISTLAAACSLYKQIHNLSKNQLLSGSRAPLFFFLALHFA
jgi:hypothetical protein